MKKILAGFFLIFCFALFQNVYGQTDYSNVSSEHFVKGKIRIKLKRENLQQINSVKSLSVDTDDSSIGVRSIDGLSKQTGITRIKRVFPFSLKDEAKHREYGLHLWFELDFDASMDAASIADQYSILDEVDLAKPVFKKVNIEGAGEPVAIKLDVLKGKIKKAQTKASAQPDAVGVTFNDPLLGDQWHYENDGRIGSVDNDIDLAQAWDKETGKSKVVVAVVDGGIDVKHEDLAANIWINEAEMNGEEGVDDDQNGFVDDIHGHNFVFGGEITPHGHGTHVSGTVAAVSNNGIGVAGVAGGDGSGNGARLMSCQVFDEAGSNSGNFAAAIVYGADNGAVISQNSWGYTQPGYYEPEVLDAVRYFIAEAGQFEGSPMKGGILFFAAGNTGREEEHYPGAFDEVVGVTSTGPTGYAAPYSTHGDWADIAAPGGDQSYFENEGGVLSTLPGNKYGFYQGTSMACPHVSGVAALVVSRFGGEDFTAEDLKKIVLNSTSRFTFEHNGKFGKGVLNASNAMAEDEKIAPDDISDLRASDVFHNEVRLSWTVPVDQDNYQPSYFYLAVSQDEITEGNFDGQTIYALDNPYEAGTEVSVRLSGLQKNSSYWYAVKSGDRYENISNISNIIHVITTDEPHFMESTRSIELDIDVTQDANRNVPMTFSNIGEGIVYWNNSVINERYYWEWQEELEEEIEEKAEEAAKQPEIFEATRPISKPAATVTSASVSTDHPDYWRNDRTEFMAGMDYLTGADPNTLLGSGNVNAGLIFATRFDMKHGYTFNLTHLEVALWPETKDKPILVELKKGSTNVEEAETVYVQEYYVDTVEVFKYYRIPVYRPQRFNETEVFWVVLHFPKEETYPFAMIKDQKKPNYFMMSADNGRTFVDAQIKNAKPIVPILKALSTGDDGSYVFMDPNEGELSQGVSKNVNVIVDAENLTNGKHLASLGIHTNDIHKPIVNIEVKVNVSGQKPELDLSKVFKYDVYQNKENKLDLEITNKGLADLEIYDIRSDYPGFTKDFNDTIVVRPDFEGVIPFNFTPSDEGMLQANIILISNIGELALTTQMSCVQPAISELTLLTNEIDLRFGEKAELELNIKNISNGTILEYDLEHYDILNLTKNQLSSEFTYNVITSDEVGGPQANKWEDISNIGNDIDVSDVYFDLINLEMQFPFYDEVFNTLAPSRNGILYFYQKGYYGMQLPCSHILESIGTGVFAPLMLSEMNSRMNKFLHYSFGDREVFTFEMNYSSIWGSGIEGNGTYSYQVVLYRDGVVEYRYKDVDQITDGMDYIVAIQGLQLDKFAAYRNLDETEKKVHSGMVIRFEPINDISMITDADLKKGILSQGESVNVKLTVDPAAFDVVAGSYDNEVMVKTNTGAGIESLPFTVNITGSSDFETNDSLVFGEINMGQTGIQYAKLSNIGSDMGSVSNVSFSNSDFSIENQLPLQIKAKANIKLPVSFSPSTDDQVQTEMTIDFDNGGRKLITLIASGKNDPEYVMNIQSNISVDLNGGELVRIPFSITNEDKGVELEYSFLNSVFTSVETEGVLKASGNNDDFVTEDYGYTWKVSDSLKIFHKWEDIAAEAEVLHVKNNMQQAVALPFQFPFYGQLYDTIWVSKNGYVTVIEPEADPFSLEYQKEDGIRGMIAPFWTTTIVPSMEGDGVKLKVENDRILLQWDNFIGEDSNTTGGSITFQLEILKDGSIFFHYKDVERWGGLLQYGLESPDETETFETERSWILAWSIFSDSSTIAIAPPLKDKLIAGEQKDFDLIVSAENIFRSGIYKDTIEFRTNSLAQPVKRIPVNLNVTGQPILETVENLEWKDVIFSNATKLKKKIKIHNKGYEMLSLSKFEFEQLDGLKLYDVSGNEIIKNSAGTLLKSIEIEPWAFKEIELEIPVAQNEDVNGTINLQGNFETASISIAANIVDSPVFAWNAVEKHFALNNFETETYTFTIENQGETSMEFNLIPAVIPSGDAEEGSVIVEELGNYEFDQPTVVDSLALETKKHADALFNPMVSGVPLSFANEFVAPEGDFFLTHVKTYNYLKKVGEYVRVMVYVGGDDPQSGEKVYQQDFVIDRFVDKQWIYFSLKQPVNIPAGEKFYVMICPPIDYYYLGYDIPSDQTLLEKSYTGVYALDNEYKWYTEKYLQSQMVWKIRPLTAAGNGQWLELDQYGGTVEGGASIDVTATINPEAAGKGTHKAKIIVSSTDVNNSKDERNINLTVNGAPKLKFRPNQYTDTLKMVETEELVLNYLFEDPEGEAMTITMGAVDGGPVVKMTQTGDKTAQVEFRTDYQSAGVYSYPVEIKDEAGNILHDVILLEVSNKNQAPVLDPDFGTITLNMADPMDAYTIDPSELFTDPDGDVLQILAGNYTPDIVDMALGGTYIDIHPLAEGTGFIVLGADDGKEDGYVLYGVYVIVINDPDAVDGAPDGLNEDDETFMESAQSLSVYPNPVIDQSSTVQFKLDEDADARFEIYNLIGRKLNVIQENNLNSGVHRKQVDFTQFGTGIYICTYLINGEFIESKKVVVK